MQFYRLANNEVAGFDASSQVPAGAVAITEAEFIAHATKSTPVAVPLKDQALAALNKTNDTVMRCYAAGIAFPAAWLQYIQALRAIVNGTDTVSTSLPAQPAYPAGT